MKKHIYGRKLKRDKNERKALFKSLMSSFILFESIQTTEAKAKSIKPQLERLVTKAKNLTNASRDIIKDNLNTKAFEKLVADVAPRFAQRSGGYTRITRIGKRLGDNSQLVVMEWVEGPKPASITPKKEEKKVKLAKPKISAKKTVAKPKTTKLTKRSPRK